MENVNEKMQPMIILPEGEMDADNIKLLRENGICVVVAKNPSAVKFVDPIPAVSNRTQIENAAIQLSRRLLRGDLFGDNRRDFANLYMNCLVKGTSLDPEPTPQEQEKRIFDEAKRDEIQKIAREEARAEKAAKKLK